MDELREAMEAAYAEEEARIAEENPQDTLDDVETSSPEAAEDQNVESEPQAQESNVVDEKKGPDNGPQKTSKDKRFETQAPDEKEPNASSIDQSQTKAPSSWSAKARESWAKLPVDAQMEITKREKEVNKVLQDSAGARRAVQELNSVLAPHANRLMAAGIQSPIQAIGTLLATEGQLRQGDAVTKAQTIAQLVQQYGVDIQTLDDVLTQQIPTKSTHSNSQLEELLNQRLAPFQQFMSQQQAYAQHQAEQSRIEAAKSVEQFSAQAEFINDVRLDMADLLDWAAQRGQTMTLDEAYQKACVMNSEIHKIIMDRERQKDMQGRNQAAQAKRNAAVSITGQPAGNASSPEAGNLRDQISQAWSDALQG